MKIIGRISAKGIKYYQTAIHEEGKNDSTFVPVFIKKALNGQFERTSTERKLDKKGVVYELIEVPDENVFKPAPTEDGTIKYILTK